jgi:hypothetical protein
MYEIAASSGIAGLAIVYVIVLLFELAAGWRIFTKAGRAGWAIIIPIYNAYVLLKIVGRSGWWLVLFLVPLVNIVASLIVALDLAKSFGKGSGFGVGLFLLGFIFSPILGFGSATYLGPAVRRSF